MQATEPRSETNSPAGTRDIEALLEDIRTFVEGELYALEDEAEGPESFVTMQPRLEALRQKVRDRGWWLPQLPAEDGGLGLSLADFGRVSEVLGGSPYGHFVFNCQAPDAGNMEILIDHGTPEQKEQFLEPLLAGETRSCFSMTEPDHAGSNPKYMSTTAKKDGEDYVIDGHKWFTSSADGAAFAIVMAITNPDAENPYARASQILVPTDTDGFELVRNIPIMGEAGAGYGSHAEVRYDGCRVPQRNVLGGEGAGFKIAQERLGPGRIHHCMRWIGICERAFDMMCERAATRELSPGEVLGTRQTIQHWIAESRAEIDASRLMVLDVAEKMDADGHYASRVDVSKIKFYVAGVLQEVLDRAIQVHGALGTTEDTPLSHWWRHERGARIYDGADEVHKSRIAREILKGYGVKVSI